MRKIRWFSALAGLVTLALASCGGSGCDTSFAGNCGSGTTGSKVASVLLVSDVSSIPSNNSSPATITAYVRDANNNFVPNVPVVFTVDTGGVNVTQATTDTNGVATATVSTLGDKTNRTITVTATADKIVATATVAVTGTNLVFVSGPSTLTAGQQASYTLALNDSGGAGIPNTAVTVTVPANMTANPTSLMTDNQGRATFTGTGGAGGTGTLKATALALTAQKDVAVNGDALAFTTPAPPPAAQINIPLNTLQAFTVHWALNGAAQTGQPLTFATTRGCINPAGTTCSGQPITVTLNTDGNGDATVNILSDNAGGTAVTATTTTSISTQITAQFIATTAASIDVQPSLFTLAPGNATVAGDSSTITAIVRDTNNNLVTNATVVFSLDDITGGTLSTASAITNTEGRAETVYTAGTVTSASGGVKITGTVAGSSPVIAKTVFLTVAKRQVFISIGTGNEITEPNTAQYKKDYIVQVTDANGVGVKDVNLSMSVLSQVYFKGKRVQGATSWSTCYTIPQDLANCIVGTPPSASVTMGCADEDFNRNGILDPGENKNGNNPATVSPTNPLGVPTLEAGNIATVTPSSVITDTNGFVLVSVYYPQEYAYYLQVTLQAQASVQGTAFSASSTFLLPGSANDFGTVTVAAPGILSPFGTSATCSDML